MMARERNKNWSWEDITVGTEIEFLEADEIYTVKAMDERFVICTAPCPEQETVYYTIIDRERDVRGTNNLVFNTYDYSSQADIDECLRDLQSGEIEVTYRNCVDLFITDVFTKGINNLCK
jgi:hypothetical protein